MPRMYCSHVAYCTTLRCSNSHHQSSPQEILAVRGGAMYKRYFLDVPPFTTSRLPRDPSSQRWNYVGEKWAMNFAWNAPHAVNLRHGTNGFTSPPNEGVLRIFSPWKIRRLRPGLNPRTWVPKASMLPLDHRSRYSSVSLAHIRARRWMGAFKLVIKNVWRNHNLVTPGASKSPPTTQLGLLRRYIKHLLLHFVRTGCTSDSKSQVEEVKYLIN